MLGSVVVDFLSTASQEAIIVAPFIQVNAFRRLLEAIPAAVDTRVVTRWRPADVLSGVSDIEVLELTKTRHIPLLLRDDLHAKLYVADDRCLVGSANVTDTALGWAIPQNLELLVRMERDNPDIRNFVDGLFDTTVEATDLLKQRFRTLIESVNAQHDVGSLSIGVAKSPPSLPPNWVPSIRNTEDLYALYAGNEQRVLRSAIDVTRAELKRFSVPAGLSEEGFRSWIAATLLQTPIVVLTVQRIESGSDVNEGDFHALMLGIGANPDEYPARDRMMVLQRWLEYFLGDDFSIVADSVKLVKSRQL